MSWIDQVGSLLQNYSGVSGSSAPQSATTDFAKVAESAPPSALSGGLSAAFRSGNSSFGEMVSQLFAQSDATQRAGILGHLMAAAGPEAASSFGGLAALLPGSRSAGSPEQAQQVPPQTVRELADAAAKHDPSIIDRAGEFYAQHPTLVKSMGAGALALIMSHLSQHH